MRYFAFVMIVLAGLIIWVQRPFADIDPFLENELGFHKEPLVVELFTSQSCSSCPPADALLGQISDFDNVIVLGFHVDYWDHLHWKDTLSQDFATDRQRHYARSQKSARVYTPQMIVNGDDAFVGSNVHQLKRAVRGARKLDQVDLRLEDGVLKIFTPNAARAINPPLQFWLFGTKDAYIQAIGSGENRGRTVTYRHAVVFEKDLGMRFGDASVTKAQIPGGYDIDRLVVLVQKSGFGDIVAAGQLKL